MFVAVMNISLFIMSIMNNNNKKKEEDKEKKMYLLGCYIYMHS